PEQVRDSHQVDIRADVYSLGCSLYHLLAGKTPFADEHPAARPGMHLGPQEPPPLEHRRPDVPPAVAQVVHKMMAKDRERRHQTPGEAAQALGALLPEGEGTSGCVSPAVQGSQVTPPLPPEAPSTIPPTSVNPASVPPTTSPFPQAPAPGKPARSKAALLAGSIGAALLLCLGCVAAL